MASSEVYNKDINDIAVSPAGMGAVDVFGYAVLNRLRFPQAMTTWSAMDMKDFYGRLRDMPTPPLQDYLKTAFTSAAGNVPTSGVDDTTVLSMILVAEICKQLAVYQVSCAQGNQPSCGSFSAAMQATLAGHVGAIMQTIATTPPLLDSDGEMTNTTLVAHLTQCKISIKAYVSEQKTLSTDSTVSYISTGLDKTNTAVLFSSPMNGQSMEDVIYYAIYPWLSLLYVARFVSNPASWKDKWNATYILTVTGYALSKTFASVVYRDTTVPANLTATSKTIATNFVQIITNSSSRVTEIDAETDQRIMSNEQKSHVLNQSGGQLEFRAQNSVVMATEHDASVNQASWRWYSFVGAICVYAIVTVIISIVVMSERTNHYAYALCAVVLALIAITFIVRFFWSQRQYI
jgi:hypothetical protein